MDFRATPKHVETLKKCWKTYAGTHSFHNFTKRIKPGEARASRSIVSFHVEDPIVFDNGMEWIPTQVLWQSFLLHQIRKMVCMAIDVTRGVAPIESIGKALAKDSDYQVGLAPAQGLFLEMSYYCGYSRRKLQNPELDDLNWDNESSPVFQRWKEFRNGTIMKHVVEEEEKQGNFIKYLFTQERIYDYRQFYKLDGGRRESSS